MLTSQKYFDTLKQKLSIKSQHLRRYKEATERKQQNKLFITNEKTYYHNSNVDNLTAKTNCWTNRL
jgi:hypothetical protein